MVQLVMEDTPTNFEAGSSEEAGMHSAQPDVDEFAAIETGIEGGNSAEGTPSASGFANAISR